MKLFYSPAACSLAPHIVLIESGLPYQLELVDIRATPHRTADGTLFTDINPKGSVPALQLDNGELLTEGAIILQYIGDQAPQRHLVPAAGEFARYRLQEWLNFIATEIHKGFRPLWQPDTPAAVREDTLARLGQRFAIIAGALAQGDYLMGEFSVADAYLFTCLNWTRYLKVSLEAWPAITAFQQRMAERSSVRRALQEEGLA